MYVETNVICIGSRQMWTIIQPSQEENQIAILYFVCFSSTVSNASFICFFSQNHQSQSAKYTLFKCVTTIAQDVSDFESDSKCGV